ncbi:helix-turn-helix transcriptional regulator [Silvimonas soli]|uniref:helix-turn-helix transcriptional regulator n=1 Tax=Silvimonas soli TaxID=2980100 RepID=UPI0024B361CB|nr:helix-turn-helix domain-containing protein [Silvimonas soli]
MTELQLIDVRQLASLLSISVRKLEELILAGDAPRFLKVGSQRRWKAADIDNWMVKKADEIEQQFKKTE